jgi:AraC-like DNA-binding protein
MVGAYLEPGTTSALLQVSAVELTDRIVGLELLWRAASVRLAEDLVEQDEETRVDLLEAALVARLRRARDPDRRIDVTGLARWARDEPARITVRRLAAAAGVSRQHLARVFRESVGVSPKRSAGSCASRQASPTRAEAPECRGRAWRPSSATRTSRT